MNALQIIKSLQFKNEIVAVARNREQFQDLFFEVIQIVNKAGHEAVGELEEQRVNINNGHKMITFVFGDADLSSYDNGIIVDAGGVLAMDGQANPFENKH